MRELTLHEKINIRYCLNKRGILLPVFNIMTALHFWAMCYGYESIKNNSKLIHIIK